MADLREGETPERAAGCLSAQLGLVGEQTPAGRLAARALQGMGRVDVLVNVAPIALAARKVMTVSATCGM